MTPLVLITICVVAAAIPIAIWASAFHLDLYREERATSGDSRVVTLSFVLAMVVIGGTLAVELVAIPTLAYILGAPPELQRAAGQLVLVGLDVLLATFVLPAIYLRFFRRRHR